MGSQTTVRNQLRGSMQHSEIKTHIESAYQRLSRYCTKHKYQGWDPYDGLTSPVFQSTPLRHWDIARWVWIQFFKLSPVNFRPIVGIRKTANPKAIALLLSAFVYRYRSLCVDNNINELEQVEAAIKVLIDQLIENISLGYSGACWGYNFDWQARRLFLFPAGTPNVVVTSFCVEALHEASLVISDERLDDLVLGAAEFVEHDLHRTQHAGGFLFSYSPISGNDTVHNASMLGLRILCRAYKRNPEESYFALANQALSATLANQKDNGAWEYGLHAVQDWIDSFHTGFILDSLQVYRETFVSSQVDDAIEGGLRFYLDNFFESDGRPNYYHNRPYPIDIHSPSQLVISLSALGKFNQHQQLIEKVLTWTVDNMQGSDGSFYYQRRRWFVSKVPYLRWSNAFMLRAMACYSFHVRDQHE